MANRRFTVVESSQNKKWTRLLIVILVLLILAMSGYAISKEYSVSDIEVVGNTTYSKGEIVRAVQSDDYVPNALVMTVISRVSGKCYLPFIESAQMSCQEHHTLTIKVKEKIRAGVFDYMGKKVYFNSDGLAVESRNKLFNGVPLVSGVSFNQLVLGEVIPVEKEYFDTIVAITKKIATYDLPVQEIHFDGIDQITLTYNSYEVYLGSNDYLDLKFAKLNIFMESVEKTAPGGFVDMHLLTDEKDVITFKKS